MKKSLSPILLVFSIMLLSSTLLSFIKEAAPAIVQQPKATDPLTTVTKLEEVNKAAIASFKTIQDISTYPAEIAAIVKRGTMVFAMT